MTRDIESVHVLTAEEITFLRHCIRQETTFLDQVLIRYAAGSIDDRATKKMRHALAALDEDLRLARKIEVHRRMLD